LAAKTGVTIKVGRKANDPAIVAGITGGHYGAKNAMQRLKNTIDVLKRVI
jgi:hypothetical protein